jgi:hypothetical protein
MSGVSTDAWGTVAGWPMGIGRRIAALDESVLDIVLLLDLANHLGSQLAASS